MNHLTSSKEKKATGFELVKPATLKVARTVADKIVQQMSSVVLTMPGFILRYLSMSKSDLILEVHVVAKSEDGDSIAKVVPGLPLMLKRKCLLA